MMTAKLETPRSVRLSRKGRGGYTLVELIVAAVIILVAVVAVVAVIRESTRIQVVDSHRRQARTIGMQILENSFDYRQFDAGKTSYTVEYNGKTVDVSVGQLPFLDDNIKLGEFTGRMSVTISSSDSNGMKVHDVEIKFEWTEAGGSLEDIVLNKRLADAK